ncbi:unnamed protein product [Cuscuta epithymum]|uniref:Citrate synthase n=1 Tax=Cuscuta epithymum TaxID=186058 RepID=A0AAV0CQP4_9ASTE|nr:unnamed protein product [Cuscuta epithymum]
MARELKFEGVVFSDAKQSKLTEVSRGGYNDHNTVQAVVEPNQKLSNPPKHYIHVRARGGQATDGHSLAERVAVALQKAALSDEYFVKRKLYPNVDFYSGLIYRAMGFPPEFFTVPFAIP